MEAMKKLLLKKANNETFSAENARAAAASLFAEAAKTAKRAEECEALAAEYRRLAGLYPVMAVDLDDGAPGVHHIAAGDLPLFEPDSELAKHVGGYAYPKNDGSFSESM